MGDAIVRISLTVLLVVGGYQFYFFCQRNAIREPMVVSCRLDTVFRRSVGWVWVYSAVYYCAIAYLVLLIDDYRHFAYAAFSFVMLLMVQMMFFLVFPVATPADWREFKEEPGVSARFLALIRRFDSPTNCFPSMHVSVATLTALLMRDLLKLDWSVLMFPFVIALSSLFTKQHSILDLAPGAILGWFAFWFFETSFY